MIDPLVKLLETLNGFSPIGVIALLGLIIYLQVRGKTEVSNRVDAIGENHLHEIAESLRRIELSLAENFSWIRSRINGKQ